MAVEFKEFNFKLAVIEQLMYVQEVMKPKFNNSEFIANYKAREIDFEEEGYDPIPEIEQYFKELEIPKDLLPNVTEINLDFSGEVYHQIQPFWDGEDEYFSIKSADDSILLPNLKKVNYYGYYNYETREFDESIPDAFRAKGIEAIEG